MRCSKCDCEVADSMKFCPECGSAVAEKHSEKIKIACPCCHQKVLITTKWCGKDFSCPGCGNRIAVPWPEDIEKEPEEILVRPELVDIDDELEEPQCKSDLFELGSEVSVKVLKPRSNMTAAMIISIAAGVILFLCVLVLGGYILKTCFDSSDSPEVITEDLGF